jgi:hypothetical protein
MQLVQADRTCEMERAHADGHVRTAAARFLAFPSDGMVRLLEGSMWSDWDPRSFRNLILTAGIPNAEHDGAYELLEATTAIARKPATEAAYCRGALLEQVTAGLLRRRGVTVLEEQRVGPFPTPPWAERASVTNATRQDACSSRMSWYCRRCLLSIFRTFTLHS